MENKSLAKNALYYGVKTVVSIIFPVITYKYAAYVLGVENVGKVEFAKSFVSYFLLIANLGINAFAIRNGAGLRDDKEKLGEFANRVFGINCMSAAIAVLLFIIFAISGIDIKVDLTLGFIFLAQIPLNLIGVEWVYNIYEDFKYITCRSIICQLVALIVMIAFVHTKDQFMLYAITLVISSHGAYIFNWIRAREVIRIRPVIDKNSIPLLIPICILFTNSFATSIYVNLDVSMLGFMKGDTDVGVYSAAVKVYTAIKSVIAITLLVALPRMSYYSQNDISDSFSRTESKIVNFMILLVPACMVGVIVQSRNLIFLVSGTGFEGAGLALAILGVALLFSAVGMVCGSTILLPDKKEKIILTSTVTGALANFLLNLVFIPWIGIYGAAFTTLISEFMVSTVQLIGSRYRIRKLKIEFFRTIVPTHIGAFVIVGINIGIRTLHMDYKIDLVASAIMSVIGYILVAYLFRNEFVLETVSLIKRKIANG